MFLLSPRHASNTHASNTPCIPPRILLHPLSAYESAHEEDEYSQTLQRQREGGREGSKACNRRGAREEQREGPNE